MLTHENPTWKIETMQIAEYIFFDKGTLLCETTVFLESLLKSYDCYTAQVTTNFR